MLKRLAIALWVPIHFAVASGHLRSSFARKAVGRSGEPIPWYSLPAVDFLGSVDFSGADVLEYGGGQSTLWWARRARSVTTVEESPEWGERIRGDLAAHENVTLLVEPDEDRMLEAAPGAYDVVIVDGGPRHRAASAVLERVREGGIVLFDDAEGDWCVPFLEALQPVGFLRVDFHGYAPGVRRKHATAMFFRPGCRFLRDLPRPARFYGG